MFGYFLFTCVSKSIEKKPDSHVFRWLPRTPNRSKKKASAVPKTASWGNGSCGIKAPSLRITANSNTSHYPNFTPESITQFLSSDSHDHDVSWCFMRVHHVTCRWMASDFYTNVCIGNSRCFFRTAPALGFSTGLMRIVRLKHSMFLRKNTQPRSFSTQ